MAARSYYASSKDDNTSTNSADAAPAYSSIALNTSVPVLDPADAPSMIMVMGVTGSGKSYLINKLSGQSIVKEGHNLRSCTQKCQMVPAKIGNTKTLLIDTPGFDDTVRTDDEILGEIAHILAGQFQLGFQLKGIIYVHRITDTRYCGSSVKTLEIFKRICGEQAMENVVLVNSRWNEIDENLGAARERELKDDFWAYMLGHGAKMTRFHGDKESAIAVASQLLIKESVVLEIQREMNEGKPLNETKAGLYVDNGLEKLKAQHEKEIQQLEALRQNLLESDRAMKRKYEKDWKEKRELLKKEQDAQVSMRRDVNQEVHKAMMQQSTSKGWTKYLPLVRLLPSAISLLHIFVSVAPGAGDLFHEVFGAIPDLLSSF